MRVISGTKKGTKLDSLEGDYTRPTLDRVKEALFSAIQFQIYDTNVLDLFGGSGALAIEAISRGAKFAIISDNNQDAIQIITQNVEKVTLKDKVEILNTDWENTLLYSKENKYTFDYIFIDPPYHSNLYKIVVKKIEEYALLNDNGCIILEMDKNLNFINETDYKIEKEKTYGRVRLIFLRNRKGVTYMEIFTLLETLEDIIERSRSLPFSSKSMVEKDEILEIIKEIRLKLPDELKQAKWVKEERQRILLEAKKEADEIVKEAENRIIAMIDEHEITKKAYEQKEEIIQAADTMSREILQGTHEYADGVLEQLENILKDTLGIIHENREELK